MGSVSAKLHCLPSARELGAGSPLAGQRASRARPFHPVGTNGQAATGTLGAKR